MNTIRNSICLTIITMVLCGFLFPLAITLIGQIFFYQQANGSLITYDTRIVG
ncbi:potassium-transporting ATPase subunit C, partial [Staphylococcus aureus]|nr:potassium-transporting ATPase subunit C [Staphylococcus aureus]